MKFFEERLSNLAHCFDDYGVHWGLFLHQIVRDPVMTKLDDTLQEISKTNIIYPHRSQVFNAFKSTPFESVRVCIIGQDPYIHANQAHGLAFSTENGSETPSLRKIKQTINDQVYNGVDVPVWNNNLTRWADQGILLLNATSTVNAGVSNSHKGLGWAHFTYNVVKELDEKGGVIFLLWGSDAQKLDNFISTNSIVLKCEHPQRANYLNRSWLNKDCFNRVNTLIKGDKINW